MTNYAAFAVLVQDGPQEAPTSSGGGGRHPAKQDPDLPQNHLPQRLRGGTKKACIVDCICKRTHDPVPLVTVIPISLLQVFEVTTSTRVRDLIRNIANKLNMASPDGFSIFVKMHDKVHLAYFHIEHFILI